MFRLSLSALPLLSMISGTLGCPDHSYHNQKRATTDGVAWTYDDSYNWGTLSEDYKICQVGTQQSPVALSWWDGPSKTHIPTFSYTDQEVPGLFKNWGYGPAFDLEYTEGDYTSLPSFTFGEGGDDETVYLIGWHTHTPAEHQIDGVSSKAEMHFVHVNATGSPRAVLGFRITTSAAGQPDSTIFSGLPEFVPLNDTVSTVNGSMNVKEALDSVNGFDRFWTYEGSLTTPPCTQGLRWFVSQDQITLSVSDMQALLGASSYSSRNEQDVWQQAINM